MYVYQKTCPIKRHGAPPDVTRVSSHLQVHCHCHAHCLPHSWCCWCGYVCLLWLCCCLVGCVISQWSGLACAQPGAHRIPFLCTAPPQWPDSPPHWHRAFHDSVSCKWLYLIHSFPVPQGTPARGYRHPDLNPASSCGMWPCLLLLWAVSHPSDELFFWPSASPEFFLGGGGFKP
jgi:hypothetical protein